MTNKCLLELGECYRKVTFFKVQKLPVKSPLTGNFYSGLTRLRDSSEHDKSSGYYLRLTSIKPLVKTWVGKEPSSGPLYTVHSALYIVHCTLYTVHCKLYIIHYTLYTVDFSLYI